MLKEGDKAPAFKLPTECEGDEVALKDLKGKRIVLYFYPKDMSPVVPRRPATSATCIRRAQEGKNRGLGVSRDSIERHKKFREKYELDFPLLSDEDGKVCEAYGVWKEKSLYGESSWESSERHSSSGPTGNISKRSSQRSK